jgi:RND family efflux transporter MFP subunit
MNRKSVISVIALLGIAAAFFFILQNNKKKNQAELDIVAEANTEIAVKTAEAKKESISGVFKVNGTFLPKTQAQVSPELGGQLVRLFVEEGSEVKAGQTIAKISGDKINVNVNNAQANLDNAVSSLNRYEEAFKSGGVTAMQLDQARLQVQNAQAQLKSAQLSSGDTNVKSKIDGVVNKKLVEVGTVVGAGTGIVEIVDISSLKLKVEVDQALVSQLSVGSTVQVIPSVTGESLEGEITFIAPASNGALKFSVEITLDNSDRKIKAGMDGIAVFNSAGMNDVLTVPREAFVGSVSDNKVFVVRDNKAVLTQIQSGVNYGDKVQVTAGLTEGDVVVTSGQINLIDNAGVKVIQ